MSISFLNEGQKASFVEDGFLVLRDAVPPSIVSRARREVLSDIGTFGYDPNKAAEYRGSSFCPTLKNDKLRMSSLLECYTHSTLSLAVQCLLRDVKPVEFVNQIALQYPSSLLDTSPLVASGVHIDGIASSNNGIKGEGIVYPFSILGGISLVVFPGSHKKVGK
jgi:hypothetical protein